jgi:hypothetical protein
MQHRKTCETALEERETGGITCSTFMQKILSNLEKLNHINISFSLLSSQHERNSRKWKVVEKEMIEMEENICKQKITAATLHLIKMMFQGNYAD